MNRRLDVRLLQGVSSERRAGNGSQHVTSAFPGALLTPLFRVEKAHGRSDESDLSALERAMDGPEPDAGIECRRLRLRDLRLLASNVNVAHLDQPHSFTNRSGCLVTALQGLQPFQRVKPITYLAFSDLGLFLGFIQFQQALPDRRWVVQRAGIADGIYESNRIVEKLLEFSFTGAGYRGVKRLFARVPQGSSLLESFRRTGFEPYMNESIYLAGIQPSPYRVSKHVRRQEPGDTWAVHQLYHACAPKHVQFAEAWTSHRWDVPPKGRDSTSCRAFVMEDNAQLVAYARIQSGNKTAVIELMYLADRRECGIELCQDLLGRLASQSGLSRVFVVVRAHQAELESALVSQGLERIGVQELMVRYTTAKVAVPAVESVFVSTQDVLERVPKRVPTYLNRPGREHSAL